MKTTKYCLLVFSLFTLVLAKAQNTNSTKLFMSGVDSIRTSLKIPGMAVAIMKDDSILLATGLGYAELKNHIKITPNTTFRVASITKTFASTIIMQLVEEGKLNLDTPITTYGIDLGNPKITVRNLLTHTSEGEPGSFYQYNGYRFSFLQKVIEQTTGTPFYQLLMEKIIQPLNMSSSAPGISLFTYFRYRQERKDMMPFFEMAFTNLAKPYGLDSKGNIVETTYFDEFGTSGGLTTNVTDLLKYSAAIDRNKFVNQKTQQEIFTPNKTINGEATPYGLGWFTQTYRGILFYWHYGQTQGESGLFVKVPSMHLTLTALTNSVNLSSPFPLGDGDLFMSPVGQLFYKYFVNKDVSLSGIDFSQPANEVKKKITKSFTNSYSDFYNKEMISQATMDNFKGDTARAKELYQLYAKLNFANLPTYKDSSVVAEIKEVGTNQVISKDFVVTKTTSLKVVGVGENCSPDFKSWCDYGWIEDDKGNVVWQMQSQPAAHAGGAKKNQKVESIITLSPGTYKLRYKSDWAHAYDSWDSLPPDNFLWGIILSSN